MKLTEKIPWLMGRVQRSLFPHLNECLPAPLTEQEKRLNRRYDSILERHFSAENVRVWKSVPLFFLAFRLEHIDNAGRVIFIPQEKDGPRELKGRKCLFLQQHQIHMNSFSFLLVDDEQEFIEALALRLRARGYTAECAFTGPEALEQLEKDHSVDIVLLDISMPAPDGMKTLKEIKRKHPLIEVIMLTGHATIHSAVEALKFGAFHYLTKPCNLKELICLSELAVVRKRAREAKLLDARMKPYISDRDRKELISRILDGSSD